MRRYDLIDLLNKIKNSLFDIQNSISHDQFFDGGCTLGELTNSIHVKLIELNDYEIGDDDFDDEYCEEEEEEEDLADLYEECKKNYEELWECHLESSHKVKELKNIIKDVLRGKCDLIELINKLLKVCEEEDRDSLYSIIPAHTFIPTNPR
jgi:hypothetical protein